MGASLVALLRGIFMFIMLLQVPLHDAGNFALARCDERRDIRCIVKDVAS